MAGSPQLLLQHLRRLVEPADDGELLERYVRQRDEAAFAALVRRHGPLVLGACRRHLNDAHAAEDAFQATFLILARKAGSIRPRARLAAWLHGVACRVARVAWRRQQRRRLAALPGEIPAAEPDPLAQVSAREVLNVLDMEVQRLREQYRLPILLCCLEGLSREEAARQLGWTPDAVKGRLERGRARLHARLAKRGVTLTAALAAAELAHGGAWAGLSISLQLATVRVALADPAAATIVSAEVLDLARSVLSGMLTGRVKMLLALVLGLGLAALGAGALQPPGSGDKPDTSPAAPPAVTPRTDAQGDPLPENALLRLGTVRYRSGMPIHDLTYTPDGRSLVAATSAGTFVWEAATGKLRRRLGGELNMPLATAALTPDGRRIAIGSSRLDREAGGVYDLDTGRRLCALGNPEQEPALKMGPRGTLVNPMLFPRLSPDGRLVVALREDPSIQLYDAATGALLHTLKGHEWGQAFHVTPVSAFFTPDSRTLISAGADGTVRFWDVATGQEKYRLANRVGAPTLAPDGALLATLDCVVSEQPNTSDTRLNILRLWDVRTGQEVRRITVPAAEMKTERPLGPSHMIFRPGTQELWTAGSDHVLRAWDGGTGREVRRLAMPAGAKNMPLKQMLFHPDGQEIWTHRGDGVLRAWDVNSGKELRQFPIPPEARVYLAPDGKEIAVVEGSSVRCLDPATGQLRQATGPHTAVQHVAVSPDGSRIALGCHDHTITLWDAGTGRPLQRLVGHEGYVHLLCFSADGRQLFSGDETHVLRVWDVASGRQVKQHRWPEGPMWFTVALSADGTILACSPGQDGVVHLLDLTGRAAPRTLESADHQLQVLAFAPDGRTLYGFSSEQQKDNLQKIDDYVHTWDLATGRRQKIACAAIPSFPWYLALAPDGRHAAINAVFRPEGLLLVDLATGRQTAKITESAVSNNVCGCRFSPDGRTLAWTKRQDGVVHFTEAATGKERYRLTGHQGAVHGLAFTTDGRRLVSGSDDTTALVWDLFSTATPPASLAACWDDLQSEDAARAYQAVRRLVADPARAVAGLRERLRPLQPADAALTDRLLADLDDPRFAVREKAAAELERLDESALPALRRALAGKPSLEVRERGKRLVARLETLTGERLRSLRAVEALEYLGTPAARALLQELAGGTLEAVRTREAQAALQRLQRRPAGP